MATEKKRLSARVRFRLWGSILNTYGYAIVGAPLIQPFVVKGVTPTLTQFAGFATGLVFHVFALYIAPHGEKA